jgi:adenosyl cobinamide kinase/adenosyl cobinamide phosphate guanylyltransferase
VVVVTNEVGVGIVPDNELARRFRDLLGRVNQEMAAAADREWCGWSPAFRNYQDQEK